MWIPRPSLGSLVLSCLVLLMLDSGRALIESPQPLLEGREEKKKTLTASLLNSVVSANATRWRHRKAVCVVGHNAPGELVLREGGRAGNGVCSWKPFPGAMGCRWAVVVCGSSRQCWLAAGIPSRRSCVV